MVDTIIPPGPARGDTARLDEQFLGRMKVMIAAGREELEEHLESDSERSVQRLLDGVNATSGSARSSWLFLLALMAYFFLAVGTITDRDLLLNSPVELPIANIAIPLRAFLLFGPFVLLLGHFGILMQHVVLARKAHELDRCLADDAVRGDLDENRLRYSLNSYFFTQRIAGGHGRLHNSIFAFISFLSFLGLPMLLLVVFQTKFLAYHDEFITWAHRGYLVADAIFILVFITFFGASRDFDGNMNWRERCKRAGRAALFGLRAVFLAIILFWSFGVATIPGKGMEKKILAYLPDSWTPFVGESGARVKRKAFFLTAYFLESQVDQLKGRSGSFFNRNLVVTDNRALVADAKAPAGKPGGAKSVPTLNLRGRDLRYATLDRSNLRGVDLTGADLTGASLAQADLTGALFGCAKKPWFSLFGGGYAHCAKLINANLEDAELAGADFHKANLSGATLSHANLAKAKFPRASLVGADLSFANLTGADLTSADLSSANLVETGLVGAKLNFAILRRANLLRARLAGADLTLVHAEGAALRSADMKGANLTLAYLQGADLSTAELEAANLRHARLQGADMTAARLTLADLTAAKLQGAKLAKVAVNGTDFSDAELWGTTPPGAFVRGGPLMGNLQFVGLQSRERSIIKTIGQALKENHQPTNRGAVLRLHHIGNQYRFLDWDNSHPDAKLWQCLQGEAHDHDCKDWEFREIKLHELMANFACYDTTKNSTVARALVSRVITTGTWIRKQKNCPRQNGPEQTGTKPDRELTVGQRRRDTARRLITGFLTTGRRRCPGIVRLAKKNPKLIERLLVIASADLRTIKQSEDTGVLDFWGTALQHSKELWEAHIKHMNRDADLLKRSPKEQAATLSERRAFQNFDCRDLGSGKQSIGE